MRIFRTVALVSVAVAVAASTAAAFNVVQEPLPKGAVAQPYDYQFKVATDDVVNDLEFRVIAGALPPGLTLSSSGRLTGRPTVSGGWKFDIQACTGGIFCSERTFELGVLPRLWITTETLPAATAGAPYTVTLAAEGGTVKAWTIVSGALPEGVTLSQDGVISGTPTATGSWPVTVKITDSDIRFDTKTLTLVVAAPLVVTAPLPPPAVVGTDFQLTLVAQGGTAPYTWSLGQALLPNGLVFDPVLGVVSGVPRLAGTFPVTFVVTEANGSAAAVAVTIEIARKLAIATRRLPFVKRGALYRSQIVLRGGIAPYRLKVTEGRLPRGIRMNTRNGKLIGRARTAPGIYRFTVTATDRLRGTFERKLAIVVKSPPKKKKK
jgi:hypothetical protein